MVLNDKKAAHWLSLAALTGAPNAQLNLGLLYLSGRGMKQNNDQGMKWIHKSAESGFKKAQIALVKAYRDGLYGLKKDPKKAYYWAEKAGLRYQ